jgi:hypothetical protein
MVELIDTASLSLAAERRTGLSPVGGINCSNAELLLQQ